MNCFQHIPESRGAIAQPPRGGATKKKTDPTTHALIGFKHPHLPQPSALHNRTCPCPLTSDNARAPTSPRSIGFCAIWDCISSSSIPRFRTGAYVARLFFSLAFLLCAYTPLNFHMKSPISPHLRNLRPLLCKTGCVKCYFK